MPHTEPAVTMDAGYAIDARGLNKYFGDKHVVKDLSLQVEYGQIMGFLGPNGSGKTTAIRMLCGLLTPDSGEGSCLGYDIRTQPEEIKSRVGYMTQRFSYWEDLTIRENLEFITRIYELANRKHLVDEALEKLGLSTRSSQLARELSGGWKQRLALAACTIHSPDLLLLDEPTAGVDPSARRDFWDELHALSSRGISVLISTHYMDEAQRCHSLAYIAYGSLLAQGTAEEIVAGQQLHTLHITGDRLTALEHTLREADGIAQTVMYGNDLHVSGLDPLELEQTVTAHLASGQRATPIPTSLEDTFIYLMQHSEDNFDGVAH